jgi:hypothetical protein
MTSATGPKALHGSPPAKRLLALLLEALGGTRSTQEAADAMGVALVRYYQLETRALQAMLEALEPRQRGRKAQSEAECKAAHAKEIERLTAELRRYKSLCRSLQRMTGVPEKAATPKGSKGRTRRVRKVTRGQRVATTILAVGEGESASRKPSRTQGG